MIKMFSVITVKVTQGLVAMLSIYFLFFLNDGRLSTMLVASIGALAAIANSLPSTKLNVFTVLSSSIWVLAAILSLVYGIFDGSNPITNTLFGASLLILLLAIFGYGLGIIASIWALASKTTNLKHRTSRD